MAVNELPKVRRRLTASPKRQGFIDNFYCIQNRISLRLGERIWDLRSNRYEIETIEQPNKNTIYKLIAKPAPALKTMPLAL